MKKIILLFLLAIPFLSCEQTLMPMSTPVPKPYSAFNDVAGWWRADSFTGSSGSYSMTDLTGNGNHMVQQAGTLTSGTGVNSKAKFTGNSIAYTTSALVSYAWPRTVITVALRANNALCGFFGNSSASPATNDWFGYETGANNQSVIYPNASINITTEAGSVAAYISRTGWGSRQTWVNGVLQATHTESSVVQTNAICSIGTQYRGMNYDWYETLVWNRCLSLDDMDEVNTYLNTRYAMSIVLWSSYTAQPVIFIWGQSNASGRGVPKSYLTSPYNTSQTNVFIYNTTWQNLDESANNNDFGDNLGATYFGIEASIGDRYITRYGNQAYIFKVSYGGTQLAFNASISYWQPNDNTQAPNNGFRLYSNWMQAWTTGLNILQTAGKRPVGVAIVGSQGENDAQDATNSANYQTNLINFYNILRPEIGCNVKYVPTPVYVSRLPATQTGETYLGTIRTAQAGAVSSLLNSFLFDTDSYTLSDGVHFDNPSLISIGIALANLF